MFYKIKSPSVTQIKVSQENVFKKSKTVGSDNSLTQIENSWQ